MTSQELINTLQNPQLITGDQTDLLGVIIEEFPYFQPVKAIHLKGLKNKDSFKYNQALKTTAAYTTDRSILFEFITSETFNQNEISNHIKENSSYINNLDVLIEDISVKKSDTVDSTLNQQIEEKVANLIPDLFEAKAEIETSENIDSEKENTSDTLNIGKPLEFNKKETHSFNEWLTLATLKPIQRDEDATTIKPKGEEINENISLERLKKFDLIDQFISKNPKLEAKKNSASTHNIAKAQMIKPEALMTETLARIYVEQKNFKKAIQSYKILSLKYPEKSGFFADQIKAIKKLKE